MPRTGAAMTYVEAYFPQNKSWVEKAPMPVRDAATGLGVTLRCLRPTAMHVYMTLNLVVEQCVVWKVGRSSHASAVVNGKLYVLGERLLGIGIACQVAHLA